MTLDEFALKFEELVEQGFKVIKPLSSHTLTRNANGDLCGCPIGAAAWVAGTNTEPTGNYVPVFADLAEKLGVGTDYRDGFRKGIVFGFDGLLAPDCLNRYPGLRAGYELGVKLRRKYCGAG